MNTEAVNLPLPFLDPILTGAALGATGSVRPAAMASGLAGASRRADLQYLKLVSKAKLEILQNYLPSWATILGSANAELCYVDCFAGPGRYRTRKGEVDGSAVITVRTAQNYCDCNEGKRMRIILMDKDPKTVQELTTHLQQFHPYGPQLRVEVHNDDNTRLVPELLRSLPSNVPAFFLIDPYSYPLSIPVINHILRRPKSEVFINFMHYQINRDLSNPGVQYLVDCMFGDTDWRTQPFLREAGLKRERGFLGYFKSQLDAKYILPFRVLMDEQEDDVKGDRTKYYLLHASNHPKAMLLMKDVMWPLGDEAGTFQYAARERSTLISQTPPLEDLRQALVSTFLGREVAYDDMRLQTWDLPYIDKHYRAVIKDMVKARPRRAYVIPVDSKTDRGLKGRDRVHIIAP